MASHSIPVDLLNPGQVFACLGFLEGADVLLGDAQGGFDWSDETSTRFVLEASGERNPFEVVLEFLKRADVTSIAPHHSKNTTAKWKVATQFLVGDAPYPYPDPESPATLPAVLIAGDHRMFIDHWGDASTRDNVKFWAGAGGYPGAALARDALTLIRDMPALSPNQPFAAQAAQSSSFRLDWRRDYIPMNVGFSPNEHTAHLTMVGFPVVEVMAAIGLTHARPRRLNKLNYRYGVLGYARDGQLLAPLILRAGLGCTPLPFPTRSFDMRLGWPGQENQARCITNVIEEIEL